MKILWVKCDFLHPTLVRIASPDVAGLFEILHAGFVISEEALDLRTIGNLIRSHVDHDGAGLDPVTSHHRGLTDCGHNNIGLARNARKIPCLGVADRDRGIGVHQQQRLRLPDIIAASQDNGICARDLRAGFF